MEERKSMSLRELFESAVRTQNNNFVLNNKNEVDSMVEEKVESPDDAYKQVEDDGGEDEREECSKVVLKVPYEVKLREILRNLHSDEIKIYAEASKEFIRLLRGDSGGDVLNHYKQVSPSCSELLEIWKQRQGKPGMSHILSLISTVLDHPDGKYKSDDLGRINLSRVFDKLARSIITTKLEDIYSELNSKEARRQSAALSVMAAVVRRGMGLASEVAKSFDFKLPAFPKLAEYQKKAAGKKGRQTTIRSFIEFAMSFLEVGNPWLLRWILQQRDMYFGVLRALGSDADDIVVYVLSTLQDKVLTPDSLVPPGLRSVLFGSVTLDQLVIISSNPADGPPAKIAYEVLLTVCTDPQNGLLPDMNALANPLKGNPRRLMELMKKLSATEIEYHRDLLLAIVKGRPCLGSTYMDEFPYDLEPRVSSTWFSAISLAADLVSSSRTNFPFGSLTSQPQDPPCIDSSEVQCLLKCIIPRSFSRIVINRGLLHSDILVRHGSMRLLLEALKSLDSIVGAIDCYSCSEKLTLHKWMSFKQEIQDEARALLPDHQVLLNLLSSLLRESRSCSKSLKRCRKSDESLEADHMDGVKKLKSDPVKEDVDIVIGGISLEVDNHISKESRKDAATFIMEASENQKDLVKALAGIWGLHNSFTDELKDAEQYFHTKLLDALTLYLRTLPIPLKGSYDFFQILPSQPFTLSISQQQSLLSLLIEYAGSSPESTPSSVSRREMYKHLFPLINLLIFSPIKGIQDQAYVLARLAISSTGCFDKKYLEVDGWLLFLPGYRRDNFFLESQGVEVFQDCSAVVSFLCDAISTLGNNPHRYTCDLRCAVSNLQDIEDASPDFSPLVIIILDKCLRLLDSDSGTFKPLDKSIISMYVCNTLSFVLQTQVDGRLLSSLICSKLTERLGNSSSVSDDPGRVHLRPLKNLLSFLHSICHKKAGHNLSSDVKNISSGRSDSFKKTLQKTIKKITRKRSGSSLVGVAKTFWSSIICATPDEILESFPQVVTVSKHLFGARISFLSCVFFCEQNLLVSIANLWPELFLSGLKLIEAAIGTECSKDDTCLLTTNGPSSSEEVISSLDFNSIEAASAAFSYFLKQAPFYALFPAVIRVAGCNMLGYTRIRDFLQAKLSDSSPDDSVLSLRLLLFWVHQIQLSYRLEPSKELQQFSGTCFVLVKHILARLSVVKSNLSNLEATEDPVATHYIQEVANTVFYHPAVTASLFHPLCHTKKLKDGAFENCSQLYLSSLEGATHPMDNYILHLLTETADNFLALADDRSSASEVYDTSFKQLVKRLKTLIHQVVSEFKYKFDDWIESEDLTPIVPIYYILCSLLRFMSPFTLLQLVHWMFAKVDCTSSMSLESCKVLIGMGCHIASGAFDLLSHYLYQPEKKTVKICLLWQVEAESSEVALLEGVYHKVIEFAMPHNLDCADLCLLKAVSIVHRQKLVQPKTVLPSSSMAIWRVIMNSPVDEMLTHCIQRTNATRAKLYFLLTEISPLHLTLFGQLMSKDLLLEASSNHNTTDEEFMMLLPVALSYLDYIVKFGACYVKNFGSIPSFYSRIILNGLSKWKSYTSQNVFQEEYDELLPSSTRELLNMFSGSLLGKAIHMLNYYFTLCGDSMRTEKRIELLDSLCPCSGINNDMLDCDLNEIDACSPKRPLNLINRVIAKIYFCRMLLFSTECQIQTMPTETVWDPKEMSTREGSDREEVAKPNQLKAKRLIHLLVSTLHKIVKRFPLVVDNSEKSNSTDCSQLFRYLEAFILRNISELCMAMRNDLTDIDSISCLEQFVRSSLLHRFDDPMTLKVLRNVLTSLPDGTFPFTVVLELLLAHSQFIPSILWNDSSSGSPGPQRTGMLFRPMSSILKSSALLCTDKHGADYKLELSSSYKRKLEVVKLLRVLYHLKAHQRETSPPEDASMNTRELLSLLMSCYGATMSEIDLEIFDLMREIATKGSDCGDIAETDYLWGNSALKLRRERKLENILSSSNMIDCETSEESRRRQFRENITIDFRLCDCETSEESSRRKFRENITIDFRLCAATVFSFPYDRVAHSGPISLKKLKQDGSLEMPEAPYIRTRKIQQYDPAFLLHFSNHSLSAGYLEPLEFVGLGLLAIAFMSMASLDEGMQSLGYDVLVKFNNALENCHNRKYKLRIRLLLTYLQIGREKPLQRISSMTAIFASEASFVLLDPSHDHYHTISELLKRYRRVNLDKLTEKTPMTIQLYRTMFWSISVNFKADRLWILRLLYAGLNLDDDAQLYMNECLFKDLLSFYASSFSDYDSKMLILQIVKKSVKLPLLARYLVKQFSLIPWLSSIIPFCDDKLSDNSHSLNQMAIVLEVVNDVVSLRATNEWLQQHAFEQLSELVSRAFKFSVDSFKVIKLNGAILTSVVEVLISTLRISQKRRVYEPHFTLSLHALDQLYQAIDGESSKMRFGLNAELGLRAVLMSYPTASVYDMDGAKFLRFILWGISTSVRSYSKESFALKESGGHRATFFREQDSENSAVSKLLRWLTASVILGRTLRNSNETKASSSLDMSSTGNLQLLLEHINEGNAEPKGNGRKEINESDYGNREVLAALILYLQQLVGTNCNILPSVISALGLLLLSDTSSTTGKVSLDDDQGKFVASLCSKIHCPPEAHPKWRWSYYQPWKELSSELTDVQKMDEQHACQALLTIFSNYLSMKPLGNLIKELQTVEKSGFFNWERNILARTG